MQRALDPHNHPLPRPRGRASGIALAACLLAVTCLPLGACGRDRTPGGSGSLEEAPGAPQLLVLEGSPYEMGWWHGRLLREWIRGQVEQARRLEPADFIEAMADQALTRLGERSRQELEGLAAGSGLPALDLLRAEVAREALRYRGAEALLLGAAGLAPTDGGFEARLRFGGLAAGDIAAYGLVIHRKPDDGPQSVSLTRAGSIGAWACVTDRGQGYLLAEVDVPNPKRKGFGSGRPLPVMAREVLTASEDVEHFTAELTGSMGHLGLGFALGPPPARRVRAMGGVQVYGAPELPWDLGDRPFLAVGAYGDPAQPEAETLQVQVVAPPDLGLAERWLRLDSLGGLPPGGPAPTVVIRLHEGAIEFTWRTGPEAARVVEMPLR